MLVSLSFQKGKVQNFCKSNNFWIRSFIVKGRVTTILYPKLRTMYLNEEEEENYKEKEKNKETYKKNVW